MIRLYGVPASRACRPLWMLEELGLDYENVPIHFGTGETHEPDYLRLNPNGHIPTLVDGGLVLWESMAINLYLARTYDGGFWPRSIADQAHVLQWSFWLMTEVEDLLVSTLMHRVFLPETTRDLALADANEQKLAKPLAVLDDHLAGRSFLVGSDISVADINAASVLLWTSAARVELDAFPNVARWLDQCVARPAAQRVLAMMQG